MCTAANKFSSPAKLLTTTRLLCNKSRVLQPSRSPFTPVKVPASTSHVGHSNNPNCCHCCCKIITGRTRLHRTQPLLAAVLPPSFNSSTVSVPSFSTETYSFVLIHEVFISDHKDGDDGSCEGDRKLLLQTLLWLIRMPPSFLSTLCIHSHGWLQLSLHNKPASSPLSNTHLPSEQHFLNSTNGRHLISS